MMTLKQEVQLQGVLALAHQNYEKGLCTHAFFKVHNRMISEDLVQNTFMKTWTYIVRGGKVDIMKAFLYHVLNNLIVDEYRKHKTTSLDALLAKGFEPSMGDPSGHMLNALDGKAAVLLISGLPPTYQQVMRMRYVQDLSLKEISLITGRSKNTVAVQIHRGIEKLKLIYHRA
jgi:RNA polymerase sigma-70 factor (ECF subfamily)